jgi:hypothetical protein
MEWLVALYCRTDPEAESTLEGVKVWEQAAIFRKGKTPRLAD